jgi:hypothetical protein
MLKDESEFHKNKAHKDGLKSQCKACRKIIAHTDYLKNKEKYLEGNKAWKQMNPEYKRREYEKRKIKNRIFVDSLKTPCLKCGEERLYVIEFHHIDSSTKAFTLCEINSHGLKEFEKEAAKGVCLCSNCHKEFHWKYGNIPSKPKEALAEYLGRDFL